MFKRVSLLVLLIMLSLVGVAMSKSESVKGIVKDKDTQESLIGAMIVLENSSMGTISGENGEFSLDLPVGIQKINITFLSYVSQTIEIDVKADGVPIIIELEPEALEMDEIVVQGRKTLDNTEALIRERGISSISIENLGTKEMSLKGISNVQEGVKKMTGISVASAGQVIVRGLGDRYSITTLNGLPIASLNPDNKLIPLDIFPSSAVRNVTVSKVYSVASFADYSGAHIDISTKEQGASDFFSFGISSGGMLNTVGQDFYVMDHVSMFGQSELKSVATSGTANDFDNAIMAGGVFDTDFDVEEITALPDLSANVALGRSFDIGTQRLDVMATASLGTGKEIILGAEERKLNSTGGVTDEYFSDSYENSLKMSALGSLGITLRQSDYITYNVFYARNASNTYKLRRGKSYENDNLLGSNNVSFVYMLLNQQLSGKHQLSNKLKMDWAVSYGITSSDEPDRREVLYIDTPEKTEFFTVNNQSRRFFGSLDENELDALLDFDYMLTNDNKITFGVAYKDKMREYRSTYFFYNLWEFNGLTVDDIFKPSQYINQDNFADGSIDINREMKDRNQYDAEANVLAGYAQADLNLSEDFLLNFGLRVENSLLAVDYHDFSGVKRRNELLTLDFFPAINMKYNFNQERQMRVAASRTVTRPSFIEMAPFEYQESFGGDKVIGNPDLENGYNYNLDFRYESLAVSGDMFSITGYYKVLENPIERVQNIQGEDGVVHTFNNANQGSATGVEVEYRKKIKDFTLSLNGSYMYTDVNLSDSGGSVYTNKDRALQGASPYLFNADLTYGLRFTNQNELHFAALYNLQGPRIYAVGLNGFGDIMQLSVHTLNFVATYKVFEKFDIKLELNNLLNMDYVFEQQLPEGGETIVVKRYRPGIGSSIGISFKF